jgi:TolB-like protein/DNA-binding winged helix-turn-helix (wHTH) protein
VSQKQYIFDDWSVDSQNNTLSKGGQLQRIDNKVMQVLIYLLERPKEIVSREELLSKLWTHQFVSDDVLNVAISSLRKHLQDSSRQPKYLKTIPRKGYQWLTGAKLVSAEESHHPNNNDVLVAHTDTTNIPVSSFSPTKTMNRLLWFGLALIVGIALQHWSTSPPAITEEDIAIALPPEQTIKMAVLPFNLYAANQNLEYIANGLTEAIINGLVQDPSMRIISRSSVMQYQENRPSIPEIGKLLGVDWILEGSVQINDQEMQVTAQLINSATDEHVWSHTYQRTLLDIFNVQAEIAEQIRLRFSRTANGKKPPEVIDPRAFDAYLKARFYLTQNQLDAALASLKLAVSIQANYADALAQMAQIYFLNAYTDLDNGPALIQQASNLALQAGRINLDSAQVQMNLALTYLLQENDYAKAGEAFARAYAMDNQDLMLQEWYLNFLNVTGQFELALSIADKMNTISPLSYNKLSRYYVLYYAGRYDEAIEEAERKRPLLSNPDYADILISWCYIASKDLHKLRLIAPKMLTALSIDEIRQQEFMDKIESDQLGSAMAILYPALAANMNSYEQAELLAWGENDDAALERLETLVASNHINARKMVVEPAFMRLQHLPRFRALLNKLKLNRSE